MVRNEVYFQQTFGCEPWFLGRLIEHPSVLAVTYGVGGLVLAANLGWIVAPLAVACAANDWIAANKPKTPKTPRRLYAWESDRPMLPPSSEPIGEETRLNAVDVPAYDADTYGTENPFAAAPAPAPAPTYTEPKVSEYTPEDFDPPLTQAEIDERIASGIPTPPPSTPVTRPTTKPQDNPIGIAAELVELEDGKLRSWFITGPTGSGKGVFATYALMLANSRIPGVSLWGIDPKADPQEYKRWAIIDQSRRYHFDAANPALDSQGRKRIEEGIKDLLDRFYRDPSPHKILWVDELPAIVATVTPRYRKELISTISRWSSMGRSRGLAIWVGSNAVGLRQNGLDKSGRDFFHCLYLATRRSAAKIAGHSAFDGPQPSHEVFEATGRAAWASTGDDWESVPALYADAIDTLPSVAAPANLGCGVFAGHEGAVSSRELAEELADKLERSQRRSAPFLELIKGTEIEDMDVERIEQKIIPALKHHKSIILLAAKSGKWIASIPEEDSGIMGELFGML